jgi:hypothetical protein
VKRQGFVIVIAKAITIRKSRIFLAFLKKLSSSVLSLLPSVYVP